MATDLRDDRRLRPADHLLDDERRIAMLVADPGDARAVRRPACVAAVEFAEGERQRRSARRRREPELMRLPAVVARVQEPPAIRCDLGARAPARLLAQHLAAVRRIISRHRHQVAAAPRNLRISDEVDSLAVG
jgi:hypothetical protein